MNAELKNLIANSKNRDALGRILLYAAGRLDQIRRDLFPKREATADEREVLADDQ